MRRESLYRSGDYKNKKTKIIFIVPIQCKNVNIFTRHEDFFFLIYNSWTNTKRPEKENTIIIMYRLIIMLC